MQKHDRILAMQWRHRRRGTTYIEVGRAELRAQSKAALFSGTTMVVYRDMSGKLWCRSESEFQDGRFEQFPTDPPDAVTQGIIDSAIKSYFEMITDSPVLVTLLEEAELTPDEIRTIADANRLIVICELYKLVPPEALVKAMETAHETD